MINSLLTFGTKSVQPEILEKTLTVRKDIVDEIEKNCTSKTLNSSTWQSLIIAPRGSGKTHIIKVLYHRLKNNKDLSNKAVIAYMTEDEVGIANYTDLMISILRAFIRYSEAGSESLEAKISAASLIIDGKKREIFVKNILLKFADRRIIILLLENFDKILNYLGPLGQGSLRDFIHQYNNISIIATSQNLIANLQDSKNSFYNFFNVLQLRKLDFEETIQFLKTIAATEGNMELEGEIIKPVFEGKLRAIYELTEGNHRLLVTFYSFLKAEFKSELSGIFTKVMNDLKPYYEQFINVLPAQQQKIIKHLSLNRNAISGKEIARACFIEPNVFSKQVSLLFEKGMIDKNKSGKDVFYELKEPLMRICFEISENPDGISSLFVDFLSAYYDSQMIRKKYLEFRYGARFQCEEVKHKYENEALMYSMALSEPERNKISLRHKAFDKIDNYTELLYVIQAKEPDLQEKTDLSNEYLKKGNTFLVNNKYKEAIKSYQKATELNPDNYSAYYNMGNAFSDLKQHREAIKCYQKTVEINPDNHSAYYKLGAAFANLKQYEIAIINFKKSVEIDFDDDTAYYNIGVAYAELSKHEEAINSYYKALALNPRNHRIFFNLGNSLANLNQYDEAIKNYQKTIEVNANDDSAYYNLGLALAEINQYEEAIKSYRKALKFCPDDDSIYYHIGNAFFDLKKYEEAVINYQKAIKINSENDSAYYNLGNAFSRLIQYQNAINNYQKVIELKPNNELAYYNMGIAVSGLKQYEEAIKIFKKAAKINPKNYLTYGALGIMLSRQNKHAEAIKNYKLSAELNPNDDSIYNNMGNSYLYLNQGQDAIKNYKKSIDLNPKKDSIYNNLGLVYLRTNQIDKAFMIFDKGLEIKPDCLNLNFSLLGAHIRINDVNKSNELISRLIEKADKELLLISLTEDVFYNLFRYGSDVFVSSYIDFLIRLMIKKKKADQLWKALSNALFDILINIENYEKERLESIEKTLSNLPVEYEDSIIPLKMFGYGVSYLKSKNKNALFNLSKEERKLFKEAVLEKRGQ